MNQHRGLTVIGGSGLIARPIIEELIARGLSVTLLARSPHVVSLRYPEAQVVGHIITAIDSERKTMVTIMAGEITVADLIANLEEKKVSSMVRDGMREFVDLRQCSFKGGFVELIHFKRCLKFDSKPWWLDRLALVADTDMMFGMARMISTLCEDVPVSSNVFRDVVAAMDWLGL